MIFSIFTKVVYYMGNIENQLKDIDSEIHNWYRFVLSFPPHLVQQYLKEFHAGQNSLVLDPFCGTGTTNVECKKMGIPSVGVEASPITHFASKVKCNWNCNVSLLYKDAEQIAKKSQAIIDTGLFLTLPEEHEKLILKNSISPIPLSKALILRDSILSANSPYQDYYLLSLAKHLVFSFSNLRFGPEVGVSRKKKLDADVTSIWLQQIYEMGSDLAHQATNISVPATIIHGDARTVDLSQYKHTIDCVITSPPYPNEKDYSRTTRLESVLLGFINSKDELRSIKKGFIRSNTKNVYKDDNDEKYVDGINSIYELSKSIEDKRIELNKTSGFERLYGRVVRLYFGGMARHLINIKSALKDGAFLAYVVGDQASYFQIPIRTSQILGEVAESIGNYKVVRIDTFRKRFATATETWLNEDVLILQYQE